MEVFTVKKILSVVPGLLAIALSCNAHALKLETGMWEVTMQSTNPMTGQPMNETSRECIRDGEFDPVDQMAGDASCRVTDRKESGNSVTWKMECGGAGMPAFNSEGTFTSSGTSARGNMKMTMSMAGQTMVMQNTWQGRHVSQKCE